MDNLPLHDLDQLDQIVLSALVAGYRARAGAKERFQALSEYELARRVGIVSYSYVAYDGCEERDHVRAALSRLQSRGLARLASVAGRYETFLPAGELPHESSGDESPPLEDIANAPPPHVERLLDEMVHLLRSIDERLRRLEDR